MNNFVPPNTNSDKTFHYACIVGLGLMFYFLYNQLQETNFELRNSLQKCKELKSEHKKLYRELKEIEKKEK